MGTYLCDYQFNTYKYLCFCTYTDVTDLLVCFNFPPPPLDVRTAVNLRVLFFSPSCVDSRCRLSKQSSHKSEYQGQPVCLSILQVQFRRFWKCKFICEATKHYKSPSLLVGISGSPISVLFSIFPPYLSNVS